MAEVTGVIPDKPEAREKYFADVKDYNGKIEVGQKKTRRERHHYFAKEVGNHLVNPLAFGFSDIPAEKWNRIFKK